MKPAIATSCFAFLTATILASCIAKPIPGAQPPVQRAQLAYMRKTSATPIECSVGADCSQKWARAGAWVTQHTTYAIKTSTNNEITTAGPIEPTTDAAYQVIRTQVDANTSTINFSATCGDKARCSPTVLEQNTAFHNYVMYGN